LEFTAMESGIINKILQKFYLFIKVRQRFN